MKRQPVTYDRNGNPIPQNLRKHLERAALTDEEFDAVLARRTVLRLFEPISTPLNNEGARR